MHGPINVKSSNISEWQMGFNSAFKGLMSGRHNQNKGQFNKTMAQFVKMLTVRW